MPDLSIEQLTALLVLITGYYAWTTNRILSANKEAVAAMREQSEAMTRPYIQPMLGLVPNTPIFVLKIRNIGKTTARNLRLTLDKDFYQLGNQKRNLRDLNTFKDEISSFPPDSEFSFWLGTGPEMFAAEHNDDLMPQVFSVTASYEYAQKKVTETTTIDFRPFLSTDLPRDSITHELKDMTREIKDVSRAIQRVGDGLRKL